MKVILLKELQGKGGEGDVVNVADGFANNYLLREGIAVRATKGNLAQLEKRKSNIEKREATRLENANKLKKTLSGATVAVDAKVGEEGQLFGSVTTAQIAEALKEATGAEIDRRRIEVGKPIKTAGEHEVEISIYRDIKANVKLVVGAEAQAKTANTEDASEKDGEKPAENAEASKEATNNETESASKE